nr:TonB-dependent receptor [Deltaproteobacteria bacterium]
MRALVIVVCVVGSVGVVQAAPARTLRGVVTVEHNGSPIAGASVFTDRGEIAITDADGYFSLPITARDREITVVADRHGTRTIAIGAGDMHIELAPVAGAEVIEVVGKHPEETKPLSYRLTADEIRTIPGAGNDILRAAQILPGVARIPFSFGGLVLRGASPRDTAIYLDGIEVPLAFHFGGVTSFYPSGMLADLTLTAGGFDASFGRAQGGLVTLTMREPRTDRWRMGGAIGLLDSAVQAEGPIAGGGITIGVRRSYFDRVVDPFVEDGTPLPSYWDFQIRTSFGDPRKAGRITPMIFGSVDRVASDSIGVTSAFVRIAAPIVRQWNALTLRVVPWFGVNTLTFSDESGDEGEEFSRPSYPAGVRAELARDYLWGHLRGGIEAHGGYVSRTRVRVEGEDPGSFEGSATATWVDMAFWAETRIKLDGERFALKPGIRVENYGLSEQVVFDPRLNVHQTLSEHVTMRQAIGRFHQPPTPGDVERAEGNPTLDSSYVDQMSLGFDVQVAELFGSITGFFQYGNLLGIPVQQQPRPGDPVTPEPDLGGLGPTFQLLLEKQLGFPIYRENLGRGRSYGLELLLKRNVGRVFWMVGYTLSS